MAGPLLIVARYNEPIFEFPWETVIVQKGDQLPNVGREASSYLWWIKENYWQIEPYRTYGFVQGGDPTKHYWHPRNLREVERFTPLGTFRVTCDWNGAPHHPGLPLERLWDYWDISDQKPPFLKFVSGANFLIQGWDLLKRHHGWYSRVYRDLMKYEPEGPWCIERFWPYVWRNR